MTKVIGKKNSIAAISGKVTSTRFWGSGGHSFAALEVNGQAGLLRYKVRFYGFCDAL